MDIIHQVAKGGGIINNLYSSEQDESRRQESLEEKKEKKGVGESWARYRSTILPRRNQRSPNPNQKRKDARNFPGILALPQLFSPFLYGGGGGDAVDTRTSRDQCVIRTRASESRKMKIKIRNECKK